MKTKERKEYVIVVDPEDTKCLRLQGREVWPGEFSSDDKPIAEIIINAANYYACTINRDWSYFERVLYYEPAHPNPRLDD